MAHPLRLELLEDRLAPAVGIPKSLVIAVDGLRGDGIFNANTPNLRSLINGTWGDGPGIDYRGAFADYATTIRDAVTVSGPNHTSIYTGVTAADHGVTGNNEAQMAAVTFPDYIRLLENSNPALRTAKIVKWALDDVVPTGADYRRVAADAANAQLAADILAGVAGSPYAVATGTTAIDALFIFFGDLDTIGHGAGHTPGSAAYRAELEQIDAQIGLALTAIRNRPTFAQEDWQIVLTSDHGGRYSGHGNAAADNYTIPFLVTSRSAAQGWLTGTPGNVDVMPTVLAHFGVPIPAYADGTARGPSVRTFPATTLAQDRVANLHFDFNLQDSSGTAAPIDARVGGGSPNWVTGKFGQAIHLNGTTGDWLTLGSPAALQFGATTDFSFSLWYKADANQVGTPPILSNQNLNFSYWPGYTLFANRTAGNQLGQALDGPGGSREWDFVDINLGEWVFISGVFDRDGNGFLYVGCDGVLYKLAQNVGPLGDVNSTLPWNLGQDGTHHYASRLNAAVDELSIWRRELRDDEVRTLFAAGGSVTPQPPLIAYPDAHVVGQGATLTVPAPGLLANDVIPPTTLYSQNFDGLPLGPAVNEAGGDGTDFTHTPPAGWTVNNAGVPGSGTATDGVTEWAGWSFAAKDFWVTVSGNQYRSNFTRGSGTVAVADPDEWDDQAHPAGTYTTLMTTQAISLAGMRANSLVLAFDSSHRPNDGKQATIDVSYDNFATSTRVFTRTTQDLRNEAVIIPVNNPAGGSVRFRFGLAGAANDWWWAVDNIVVTAVPAAASFTAALATQAAHGTAVVNANGSFTYTPQPGFVGTDTFTYATSNGSYATTAPVTVTVLPRPRVTGVTVNGGSAQRSQVTSLAVTFSTIVSLTNAAIQLTRVGGGPVGGFTTSAAIIGGMTVVTLGDFTGAETDGGSLADGRYTLTVVAAAVSANGLQLDGNGDGTSGDNYVSPADTAAGGPGQPRLYRLFGDATGDGLVDLSDLAAFRGTYNAGTISPFYLDYLDADHNGTVDLADLSEFRGRYNRSVF